MMRLLVKVQDVPDAILHPICELLEKGRVTIDGWTLAFPDRKGSVQFDSGKVVFRPGIHVSNKMLGTTVTEALVEKRDGAYSLLIDIDMSPIDLRLV
jgi:hypothetical protein